MLSTGKTVLGLHDAEGRMQYTGKAPTLLRAAQDWKVQGSQRPWARPEP